MHEDYEYVKSLEKEVDKLESKKADFSNIYDLLLEEFKECECLAQKFSKQTESVNKEVHNKLLKSFAKLENHSISLELALQQCKEQMKNNSVCKENGSNVFRKEHEQYHEIQDLKAQMQDKNIAISELKKLIEKCKGKSVETQFDKPSVVRQPNAQRIPKPSVLGKPTPFSNSPKMRSFQMKQSVNKTNVSDGLFKQVTQQNLPQNRKQAEIHSNVLKPGMYRIATTTTQNREPQLPHASRNTNPHVSKSSGVNHTTSVSRPQLKCYQVKDKVVPNNSQVKFKKKKVEDHHRISSISKKTKYVTACNDSSNSRTSNVNAVCAECGKCVFNSNHDACVSRYLNDVNARTKKPNVVPISASKPKRKANKSVATPHKKTVASDTTIQKSKRYKWTQKPLRTKKIWMPKIRKDDVSTSISPTIDIVSRITNIVQLILFIVDSGCTKHMTGNLKLLCNFVEKFLGTVLENSGYCSLENDQFAVLQSCDGEFGGCFSEIYLFCKRYQEIDLLTASPTQAWLWHRRLSHLNFDYITLLSKKDIVIVTDERHKFLNTTLHAYFKEKVTSSVRQTKKSGTSRQNNLGKNDYKAKVVMEEQKVLKIRLCSLGKQILDFSLPTKQHTRSLFQSIRMEREKHFYGPLKEEVYVGCIRKGTSDPPVPQRTWYPKDSALKLTSLSHADHRGRDALISILGKSTSGGIQFLVIASNLDCQRNKIALQCLQQVVRLGINPMIQPEPEDLPKDNPKLEIAVLRLYQLILFSLLDSGMHNSTCGEGISQAVVECCGRNFWALVPQGQKASGFLTNLPVPLRKNVVPTARRPIRTTRRPRPDSAWIKLMQDDTSSVRQIKSLGLKRVIDFEDSFAPVLAWKHRSDFHCIRSTTILFLIYQMDVSFPEIVYLLRKALYGLKQSSRAWFDELSNF
ncbi:retrovirus-related pol polyprotein from transposon TNT 1-94 [Tanacetum coccineum]|uniref:Retrovirus-related pol polyprotein from transposon TNT 1-94 n=1 Tax=Tanacetum coccineum TaxID=301880 RepID=A0ABQ5IVE9_9ASTR